MKNLFYIIALSLALASVGCDSKKGVGSAANDVGGTSYNGDVPPLAEYEPDEPELSTGTTVTLNIDQDALEEYVGWSPEYVTGSGQLVVSVKKYASYARTGGGYDYSYGGKVQIKFKDQDGYKYTDIFSSTLVNGENDPYNTVKSQTKNHQYNLLSVDYPQLNGRPGFHGFFEDTNTQRLVAPWYGSPIFGGAIVLVIDHMNDLGDGQGPTSANGSVWFKNYLAQYPMGPIPNTSCWFISAGPYDCRAWKSGNGINTKNSIYPDSGYTKLGTFTDLDIKAAFNNEI